MRARSVLLFLLPALLPAQGWKAGVAREKITPEEPIRMAGYGSRNHPSEGVAQDLWAKALALEDPNGRRAVIVTTDLIGLTRAISEPVAARVHSAAHISRERLLLTSSHTHAGPTIGRSLPIMYEMTNQERAVVSRYTVRLQDSLVSVVLAALDDLAPANISYRVGSAGFVMNRREKTPDGVKLGVNPGGPVDRDVPVLRVLAPDRKLRAVLFSYACHNTTLGGDMYRLHGDYAGAAQTELEKAHPGAAALFMIGTGADANPEPRGDMAAVEKNGQELAEAVSKALQQDGRPVRGRLGAEFVRFAIPLAPAPSREEFERRLNDENRFIRRHAAWFLEHPAPSEYEFPLQSLRLGEATTIVAFGGETVVAYGIAAKKAIGADRTWPVAYANDVFAYIPTAKIIEEGGYEADRSQIYYGMPGPWAPEIEETILDRILAIAAAP